MPICATKGALSILASIPGRTPSLLSAILQGAPVTASSRKLQMVQDGWGDIYRACRRGTFQGGWKARPVDHQERTLLRRAQAAMLPASQPIWLASRRLGSKSESYDPEFIGRCV